MRQAERAIFDLRRGLPILVRDNGSTTLLQAVEGLDDEALAALQALSGTPPGLVLSSHRMAALGVAGVDAPATVSLSPLPDSLRLRELACVRDARLPAGARHAPADKAGQAAVRLLSHALLVPAAVTSTVSAAQADAVAAEVASGNLLVVDAGAALELGAGGPGALTRISEARVPLAEAENSRFVLFREADGVHEHVAVVIGTPADWPEDVPVRLHSSCLTGDLFGSLRCDCGEQLRRGVAAINAQGGGVLLYLSQEGRGIGLANKLRAYGLQDEGLDTIDADQTIGFSKDERNFRVAHEMLQQLGVSRILLLTNNPGKVEALQRAGINVTARQAIYGDVTQQNQRYLTTKANRHGHWLHELLNEQGEPSSQVPESLPAPETAARS
ncbi:GTP cyclohydrolase II [Thauera linaloolentis]|uniref:GTP cyclohydrolase-2 n=1 Tax=Thauera linaloolentis (strain DSM 12138 / JCM 21573 / CCUG 41526 / CIP 105981 / IAM 15112 / NBRC 102519 / 47Lol) TaxID=1123367 RepID=N6YWN1_THAL4|nr:GTP cyclohydrolase II [Thauera linaloolentis]ENO86817.1 GTP cyclohydrolase II [Thauera linaloolentis 47Lol = DSM 12138]MCM8564843.1 GTP cyclohydrolase II [Thauera linaloolentis]